jgi:pyridoxine kinase
MPRIRRIAAIHDISCFGKCSLTIALPVISAMGVEVSVVPTAILSTHMGGFEGFTYRDLTQDILPIARHWHSLGLSFDALYTGFLGSSAQLEIVAKSLDLLKSENTLTVIDPVMGDNGRLYKSFYADYPAGMRALCAKADVLVPNVTEAALLTQSPYRDGPCTPEYAGELLERLARLGPGKIVLTGVSPDASGRSIGAASYDAKSGEIRHHFAARCCGHYHGTGDVFASVLVGALTRGHKLYSAAELAVDFTAQCIERTQKAATDRRFGVDFESGLAGLAQSMQAPRAQ